MLHINKQTTKITDQAMQVRLTLNPCLIVFQVSIPGLATQYQPPKLCRTVDEAKCYAAEYTLQQLGVPLEGMSR